MKLASKRVFGILFFLIILFSKYRIFGAVITIDTRVESATADVNKAFVYINQQAFDDLDYAYGNVEFRGGLIPNNFNTSILLGTTPPLRGPLDAGPQFSFYSIANYVIDSAPLTLDNISFSGPNDVWFTRFGFVTTSTIHLQSDLILNYDGLNLQIDTAPVPGTIDGHDNKIILYKGVLGHNLGTNTLTYKNVKFVIGSSGMSTNAGGNIVMRDVEIIAQKGQETSFYNATYTFLGTRNIWGYSGRIIFPNNSGLENHVVVAAQSRVTVTPGTTILLGLGSTTSSPYLSFTDSTSELFLDSCTIDFSPQPVPATLALTKGTIYINGNVTFTSGNGDGIFQLGDGVNQANNCELIILPGSKLIIGDGVTLINANV